MKQYQITIPAFTLHIVANSRKEALEQFWFDFDCAQDDPAWQEPQVTVINAK